MIIRQRCLFITGEETKRTFGGVGKMRPFLLRDNKLGGWTGNGVEETKRYIG